MESAAADSIRGNFLVAPFDKLRAGSTALAPSLTPVSLLLYEFFLTDAKGSVEV
jgi:hypothetical protein